MSGRQTLYGTDDSVIARPNPDSHAKPAAAPRAIHPRPSLPIVEHLPARLSGDERSELEHLAARLVCEEPALTATGTFGPSVRSGVGRGLGLLIEDHSEIALAPQHGDSCLEYRSMFLAGDGDFMIVGAERDLEFESYCLDLLGSINVKVLSPRTSAPWKRQSLASRCTSDPALVGELIRVARRAGEFTVLPYMGTGGVWTLARVVAERSGARIYVAAPSPRLVRRVNDKLWFARLVAATLGRQSLPLTHSAFGPAALSGRVSAIARSHDRVVIKIPDSSGAEGNLVLDASSLKNIPVGALRDRLVSLLHTLGWPGTYPLAVGEWESPVIDSPSVQLWIPDREDGPPIVQGIFSQVVEGDRGEFVGAVSSELPGDWPRMIAHEAVVLSTLFQMLGYFGPCSFDAVLVGPSVRDAKLHWIECNGRWGGVSVPIILANRLHGDWRKRPLAIVQRTRRTLSRRTSFYAVLERLAERLYVPGAPTPGVVLLTPGCFVSETGVHLVAFGNSGAEAKAEAARTTAILSLETRTERRALARVEGPGGTSASVLRVTRATI